MSRQEEAAKSAERAGPKAAPVGKEKLSRLSKRHRKEARKKRRAAVALLLLLGAVLALGAALDIPYINLAREAGSWIGERLSSRGEEGRPPPDYLYFTHPQSGRRWEDEVSVLLAVYRSGEGESGERVILALALLTYDIREGTGEVYLLPESSVAYNASGEQTDLRRSLQEKGGEELLRSTVGNLAGTEVDYLLLLEFWEAMRLVQELGAPPVVLSEKTVLVNPLNGETNYLVAGQEIRDADRLLFYLLGTDALEMWEAYAKRVERAGEYLLAFLSGLRQQGEVALREAVSPLGEGYLLAPGTGSAGMDGEYLASMLQSFAQLSEGELALKAVPEVEVLNGCGVPDLGRKVGERLASLGVPVAGTGGNAKVTVEGEERNDFSHEASTIICRSEDPRAAAFATYLGVLLSIGDIKREPGPGPKIVLIAGRDLAGQ